jgi:hypothetical protein
MVRHLILAVPKCMHPFGAIDRNTEWDGRGSAARSRLRLSEAFGACDGMIDLMLRKAAGIRVLRSGPELLRKYSTCSRTARSRQPQFSVIIYRGC